MDKKYTEDPKNGHMKYLLKQVLKYNVKTEK